MENNEKRVSAILDEARKKVKEKTIIGGNSIASVGAEIKRLTACGTICLAFCDEDDAAAARAEKSAAGEGFTVLKMRFCECSSKLDASGSNRAETISKQIKKACRDASKSVYERLSEISEDVRVYVGVGGFELFEAISAAAHEKDARFIFIPTRDVCGELFSAASHIFSDMPFSILRKRRLPKGKNADRLIFDTDLLRYNERAMASAYGALFSKYAAVFERFFSCKLKADAEKEDYICAALRVLNEFFDHYDVSSEDFAEKLVYNIALTGVLGDGEENPFDCSEYALAVCANSIDDTLSVGEYRFLYGYYLPSFYSRALNFKGIDLEFPPDKIRSVKFLDKALGVSVADGIRAADARGTDDFLKTEYLISEFRADFLDFLKPITENLPLCARSFRRIYSDAGYFLREAANLENLTAVMSACAITVDKGTFLSYLKSCGHLERYIPQSA